ncbi:MAG: class A beta-lactamase-related serine hydrolase, partial [Chitinophagaceae bacterium]
MLIVIFFAGSFTGRSFAGDFTDSGPLLKTRVAEDSWSLRDTVPTRLSSAHDDAIHALETIMHEKKVVGLSVAVIKHNKIIFTKALGQKNIAANIPLTENDLFRIASISKSFTATAVMKLVESGKLSLSDDVSTLIGFPVRNAKYPGKVITIKMVLSHTSSINDSQGY